MRFVTSAIAVLALFDSVVFANQHAGNSVLKKRHFGRSPSALPVEADPNSSFGIVKRTDNVRFSFFDPGLGACGGHNSNSDYIVALNTPQWDGGSHCGKTITVRWKGKSTQATIVDRCVECPYGGLDFSRGLFDFFASQDEGYLWGGSWDFGTGPPPPEKPKPETTSQKPKPTPTPTPTPTPKPETTTKEASTTTTSSTKSKTSSTQSSSRTTSSSTTESATPTPTVAVPPPDSFLGQLNFALMGLAGVAAAAVQE